MDKFSYSAITIILVIQVYKFVKQLFANNPSVKSTLDKIDTGFSFVYSVVPGIYKIIEDMAAKGHISKDSKWISFLKLLDEQAEKEGVILSDGEKARAKLIVDTLAAEGHEGSAINPL